MLFRVLIFLAIAAVAFVAFQAWRNRGPRRLFTIRVLADHVQIDGHVPTRPHSEVIDLVDELRLAPGAIIYGVEQSKTAFAVRANQAVSNESLRRLRDYLENDRRPA